VIRIQRAFALALTVAIVILWAAAHARAAVTVGGVDTGGFPTVAVSVVTSKPSATAPSITENGHPAASVEAANLGRSKTVVLAIDRSRSMAGRSIADAAAAADAFVSRKPAADRIGVVAFGSSAVGLTSFSSSTSDADGALRSIAVDGRSGTALYDAVVLAAKDLGDQTARGRVIILLTDGRDVSSRATLDDAIAAARAAGASVYPIAIDGPEYSPGPLQKLAASTGGTFFRAGDSGALTDVYATIASRLARTWRVSYLTSARPGESVKLRVTVPGLGAAARNVQVPAGPGGGFTPPGPSRLLPRGFYGSTVGTFVVALAAGLLVLLGIGLVLAAKKSAWVRERLEPHVAPVRAKRKLSSQRQRFATISALMRGTERVFGDLRQWRALKRLLDRADVPLRPAELLYITLSSTIVAGVIGAVVMRSPVGLVVGGLIGGAIPLGFVVFKARQRLRSFENQLPDLLITLAASLKAGHSFRQGIQTVVDEGQAPASDEFKRVLTDTQLGRPMEDALNEMSARVGSDNFSFVITAVTIQRQVGGSLAGLFDMIAETVRQRQQFARRIKSLTAMGRMSAYVLIGLPFFLAFALSVINRGFMAPLWETHTGHMLIGAGIVMMGVGSVVLKKIVSFKG
jgi:tight adherence protein B